MYSVVETWYNTIYDSSSNQLQVLGTSRKTIAEKLTYEEAAMLVDKRKPSEWLQSIAVEFENPENKVAYIRAWHPI